MDAKVNDAVVFSNGYIDGPADVRVVDLTFLQYLLATSAYHLTPSVDDHQVSEPFITLPTKSLTSYKFSNSLWKKAAHQPATCVSCSTVSAKL